MSAHVLWTRFSLSAVPYKGRRVGLRAEFEDNSRDREIFHIQKSYPFHERTLCFHSFQHIWVSGFIARCGRLPQLMETNKADRQMDEELKSAVKPVFICDPAAVTAAGS